MSSGYLIILSSPWAQRALIVLLSLAGFAQALEFAFLNLDDHEYVVHSAWVAQGLSLPSAIWALTTFESPYYMPLTRLSFLLDGSLFGLDPRGFHLTNLLLHSLNSLLVLGWVRLLGFRDWVPVTVAALFAVHPQHLEAVVWVAERKELLSALFGLLSLHAYVRFSCPGAESVLSPRGWLLLSLLSYLMSLLAKPMWVTLPVLLLILDAWPLRRIDGDQWRGRLVEKLPFLLLALAFTLLHSATAPGAAGYTISSYGAEDAGLRIGHALIAWASYFGQSLFPAGLSTYAPYPEASLPLTWMLAAAALILVTSAACWHWRHRYPGLLAGWLWFSIGLAPAIGIGVLALLGMKGVGEAVLTCLRFTYMPHVGLFLGLCASIHAWSAGQPRRQRLAGAGLSLAVAALLGTTLSVGGHWRDSEAFWQRSLAQSGEHYIGHYYLGRHYLDEARSVEAIDSLQRARRLNPDEAMIALALGNAYRDTGQMEAAYAHYALLLDEARAPPELLHMQALSFYVNGEREQAEIFREAARQAGLSPEQERRNLAAFESSRRDALPASGESPR